MNKEKSLEIGFFQKYLTIWVALCMIRGVLIGKNLPSVPAFFNQFEYANVSIPTHEQTIYNRSAHGVPSIS